MRAEARLLSVTLCLFCSLVVGAEGIYFLGDVVVGLCVGAVGGAGGCEVGLQGVLEGGAGGVLCMLWDEVGGGVGEDLCPGSGVGCLLYTSDAADD